MSSIKGWVVIVPQSEWSCGHDHKTVWEAFECLDRFKAQRDEIGLRFDLKLRNNTVREQLSASAEGK